MLNVPRTKNEEPIHVPLNDAAVGALKVVHNRGEGRGRVFQSEKRESRWRMGGTGSTTRGDRSADQELSVARLATYICDPIANETCSAGRYIAVLLGHKSLTMTRRYAHLGANKLHGVVSLLGAIATTTATGENTSEPASVQVVEQ